MEEGDGYFPKRWLSWLLQKKKEWGANLPSKKTQIPNPSSDFFDSFINNYDKKTRLIISLAAVGLTLFLLIASFFPFKDKLFSLLYPKSESRAATCTTKSLIPEISDGFIYTGGDLTQAIKNLNTHLYYTYDATLGPEKHVYMIGKYAKNFADPLSLKLLMNSNLSNTEFKGLGGQVPIGWNILTSGKNGTAAVENAEENTVGGGTSVKISNFKSPSGTQLTQVYRKAVSPGQFVIFGVWVKTPDPSSVKMFLQNNKSSYQQFGEISSQIEINHWTYALGYGKVPDGVTNFQVVLRVTGQNNYAWFDGISTAVLDGVSTQALTDLVLSRCGSAWLIDDEPGWEQTFDSPFMKPLSPELYALIYHEFYNSIKDTDPAATIIPGGLSGAPHLFESIEGYSPQLFLDKWRQSYKNFFGSEPPIDALNMHYLADNAENWSGADSLATYLKKLRSYMDQVPDWKQKPIWIGKLGVAKDAPSGGVNFVQAALDFLKSNKLNITKWFWYDTCGFNSQLLSLFESSNKLCAWPMKLTPLGKAYKLQNSTSVPAKASSTPASTASSSSVPVMTPFAIPAFVATSTATPVPSPILKATKETTPSAIAP